MVSVVRLCSSFLFYLDFVVLNFLCTVLMLHGQFCDMNTLIMKMMIKNK